MSLPDFSLTNADLRQIIQSELSLHPRLTLIDVYKLIFQALSGPAHIIRNKELVADSIYLEVLGMTDAYLPEYQDIGNGIGYVRLSLGCLLPAKEQGEEILRQLSMLLAECMMQSCSDKLIVVSPAEQWELLSPLVKSMVTASTDEWKQVNLIAAKEQIPSHSPLFKQSYQPHYRLIHPSACLNIDKIF